MFEQAFRNIDNDLRNEAGCTTELDDTELRQEEEAAGLCVLRKGRE